MRRGTSRGARLLPMPLAVPLSLPLLTPHQGHHAHAAVAHGQHPPNLHAARQGAPAQKGAQVGQRERGAAAGRAADAGADETFYQAGRGGQGGPGLLQDGVEEGHKTSTTLQLNTCEPLNLRVCARESAEWAECF